MPRRVGLAVVGALQFPTHIDTLPPDLRELARTDGHRLQDLVCDTDDLHALVNTGWP